MQKGTDSDAGKILAAEDLAVAGGLSMDGSID